MTIGDALYGIACMAFGTFFVLILICSGKERNEK